MKKLIKHIFIVFYSCTLLGACAATNGDPPMERDINERGSDCISIRTIRDYTPLDNSSLLIEGSGNRFYYVTLGMSSFELRGSHRIGVESRDEWLCPYGGDGLVFDGFANGRAELDTRLLCPSRPTFSSVQSSRTKYW